MNRSEPADAHVAETAASHDIAADEADELLAEGTLADSDDPPRASDPRTLEEALEALRAERRAHSDTRSEARKRRRDQADLRERVGELEERADSTWRAAAIRAIVERESLRQGARRPELVSRLVDLNALDGASVEEIELHAAEAVRRLLDEDAPELRRPQGQTGALRQGVRDRAVRTHTVQDDNDWLRRAARRTR
jgi:hypothetical protein